MRKHFIAWLILAGAALWGGPVQGHAVLTASQPPDGAVLLTPQGVFSLTFNEAVTPIRVQLIGPGGLPTAVRVEPSGDGTGFAVWPAASLIRGGYTLSYRVTSADSHPVAGAIQFSVGTEQRAAPATEASVDASALAAIVNRAAQLAALLIAAGGGAFLLLHRAQAPDLEQGVRHPLAAVALAGSGLSILAIGLQGTVLLGTGMEGLLQADTWRLGYASTRGTASVAAVGGLFLLAMGLTLHPGALARGAIGLGALIAIASFALSGHAATATPQWLALPALLLHVALVAYWIGAFLPLRVALARDAQAPTGLVATFSGLALLAVPALTVAGLLLGTVQIGALDRVQSTYGYLLGAKIALVGLLIAIAAYNKLVLMPRLARHPAAGAGLRRTIAGEMVVALAILGVTAVLAQTPPPRTQSAAGRASPSVTVSTDDGMQITATLTPGRAGPNALDIALADRTGAPLASIEVAVSFAQPAIGIEPVQRPAVAAGPGRYRVGAVDLVAGVWEVEVTILVTDFDRVVVPARLRVSR